MLKRCLIFQNACIPVIVFLLLFFCNKGQLKNGAYAIEALDQTV